MMNSKWVDARPQEVKEAWETYSKCCTTTNYVAALKVQAEWEAQTKPLTLGGFDD